MDTGDHNGQKEEQRTQIGAVLEQKRREKGLSLKDVEQATKIRTRYLESLEREDYGVLPDAVYVQGFLKTYANFLGLDGEQLSRELKDRRSPRRERQPGGYQAPAASDFEQPLITPGDLGGPERRRVSGVALLTVALAVLVLAATVGGLYLIGARSAGGPGGAGEPEAQQEDTPAETEAALPAEQTSTEPAGETPTTTPTTTPTAGTVWVTVRVTSGSSGLSIYTDGTLAYSQVAQSGFSRTFQASNEIAVSATNAGVVQVEANGRSPEPLGNPGQGATRTFTRQSDG